MKYLCPRDFRRGEMEEKMQKNKVGTMEKMKKDEFDQIFDLMKLSFPII